MNTKMVKLVIYAPETHADAVREAMGESGAGRVGNYSHTSFSTKGVGRFLPLPGAHPAVGEVGRQEEVVEERIETVCGYSEVAAVLKAVRAVHPYEEIAYDILPRLEAPTDSE